jgi:thiamine kinase-like enzyme
VNNRDREKKIESFLTQRDWLRDIEDISFLASGEYNENYYVRDRQKGERVFRINHGSQLDLENQVEYEFQVLQAVYPSGVTPAPVRYELDTPEFSAGVMLMEYLPGRPFSYAGDSEEAAKTFARIHSLEPDSRLVVQKNPVISIAEESLWLINRYPDHPLVSKRPLLFEYQEYIVRLGKEEEAFFSRDRLCMVNTEVNSGNFIVGEDRAWLVDWEKAVVSSRYQDLGHFLVPTTTRWKTDHVFDRDSRIAFLEAYRGSLEEDIPIEDLDRGSRVLEKTILLRALSWCYMAYFEYTGSERTLTSTVTFDRIRTYLDEIETLLVMD